MHHCYEPDRELDPNMDLIICNQCIHKRSGICCDAFPKGIPSFILRNGEHYTPVAGDNGIIFEARNKASK